MRSFRWTQPASLPPQGTLGSDLDALPSFCGSLERRRAGATFSACRSRSPLDPVVASGGWPATTPTRGDRKGCFGLPAAKVRFEFLLSMLILWQGMAQRGPSVLAGCVYLFQGAWTPLDRPTIKQLVRAMTGASLLQLAPPPAHRCMVVLCRILLALRLFASRQPPPSRRFRA